MTINTSLRKNPEWVDAELDKFTGHYRVMEFRVFWLFFLDTEHWISEQAEFFLPGITSYEQVNSLDISGNQL